MADIFSDLIPGTPASGAPARPDGTIFDDLMAPPPRFPGSPGAPLDMGGEMPIEPFEAPAGPGSRMVPGAAAGVPFLASGLPPIAPTPGDGPLTAMVSGWQPPAAPAMDPMAPIPMPAAPYAVANPWLAYPGLAVRGAAETGLTMGMGLSAGAQQPTDEGNALWDAYLRMDPKSPTDVAEMRRMVQASPVLTPGNKQAFQSAISDRMEGAPAVWKRDLGIGPPVDSDMAREMERRQDQLRNYMPASREQEESLFGQALRGGGSTALFLPFAALPGGIWAAGAAAGMGEAAQRAYQDGATDQQQRRATMLGAGPGALDALAVESVLRPIVWAPGAMGWVQGVVATALRTGLIEGTTEGVQQFAQNLISRTVYNPEQALAEGVPENVVVGFLAGVGLGGVGGMFARRADADRYLPTREQPPASPRTRPTVDVGMPEAVAPSPAPVPTPATAPSSVPAGAVPIDVLYGAPAPSQPAVPAEAATPVPPSAVAPGAPDVVATVGAEEVAAVGPAAESAAPDQQRRPGETVQSYQRRLGVEPGTPEGDAAAAEWLRQFREQRDQSRQRQAEIDALPSPAGGEAFADYAARNGWQPGSPEYDNGLRRWSQARDEANRRRSSDERAAQDADSERTRARWASRVHSWMESGQDGDILSLPDALENEAPLVLRVVHGTDGNGTPTTTRRLMRVMPDGAEDVVVYSTDGVYRGGPGESGALMYGRAIEQAQPIAPEVVQSVGPEEQGDIFADLVTPAQPQPVVVTPPETIRPLQEGDAAQALPPEPVEPVAAPDAPQGRGGTIFDDLAPAPAGEMVPGGAAGLFPDALPAAPAPARRGEAPVGLESVDPASVRVDADRFQFKGGGDAEGVTERLQGIQTWDPMRAGVAVIYEEADGSRYIVDGHQRLALAKRLQAAGQSPRLNAMVLREADGVTPESARIAAALKNIAEGTGTAVDAARVFRDTGLSDEMVRSLPPRSVLVRDGQSLARLSDDALGMVINGVVPENFAAFVGRENFTPTQQLAALQALARAQPANATQAAMMVRDIRDSGFLEGEQSSLFGEEAFAQTLIAERAKVLDAAMKRLRTDRATFRTLVERSDIIAEAGNQLAQDANAARLTEDEQAAALLSALATRRGPLSDALNDAARKLAAGTRIGSVTADFLRAVRQLAGLAAESREPGDAGAGAGRPDAEPRLQRAPGQVVPLASRVAGIQSPATAADRAAALGTVRDIVRRIAGDTGISPQVADRLFEVDRSGAPVGEVYGAFDPSTRQILASLASPNMEGTIRHELIHALRAVGAITPEQWQVLERAARDQGWVTDRIRRGYPAEQQLEEAVAQKFADYMGGRINPLPAVNRIFAAIRNFLNRLRQALRMNPTWRSIFQDIEAGRMATPDRAPALAGVPAMQQGDVPRVPKGFFGPTTSAGELRRAARAWAERNLYNRTFRNADSGIEIRVNRAGIEKTTSHGPLPDQILAIAAIPEMIERARFVRDEADVKNPSSTLRYLHFATDVQVGDRVYDVDLVARRGAGPVPTFYYDHALSRMEERGRAGFSDREGGRSAGGSATGLPPGARTDNVGGDDTGGKFQRRPPPPRRTSADGRTDLLDTVDGPMEQFVLPGAERLTDRQLAERQMQERLRSRRQQQASAGPLFDDPDGGQGSLFQRADDGAIAPPFYSALFRGVERLGLGKGSGAQWAGAIRNLVQKGVKQAEIDWSGVLPWLAEQTGNVSRADVLAYLRSQAVDVQEVVKGDAPAFVDEAELRIVQEGDRWVAYNAEGWDVAVGETREQALAAAVAGATDPETAPRYEQFTLPGGKNYRELLLTLPRVPTRDQITPTETAMAPLMPEWNRLSAAIRDARARRDAGAEAALTAEQDALHARMVDATIAERGGLGQNYTTPHFDEPNVLAHVRFDERAGPNGERVLFIEEIQSDWHQAGRKKGYKDAAAEASAKADFDSYARQLANKYGLNPEQNLAMYASYLRMDPAEVAEYERRQRAWLAHGRNQGTVPDAPLKTTWPETAFRRMVRWAAEHGFDRIAWTTGDMQTERFDLSKQVDSLLYKRNPDGTYRVSAQIQGRGQMLGEAIPADRLDEYVGKEIAERIVAGAGPEMDIAPNNAPRDVWRSLKGVDLKVGGEGMRGFYDRILPAYASKFGKPFGAKAEMAPVRAGGGVAKNVDVPFDVFDVRTGNVVATYRTETAAADDAAARGPGYDYDFQKEPMGEIAAHSLPITPEMANSALGEGFPLWQIPDMDERQTARSTSLGRGIRDGRPIDQLLALPFRAIGGVDVQGRWKPGRKLFDWGASVLTEKKMNPNGPLRWLNPMLETARAGLVDRYGLDPAYVERDRARQVEEIKLASRGLDFLNDLKKRGVDAQEARALHAILTGEQMPDSEWNKIAEPIRNAIDDMGLTAVSLGLVDRESYERNKGAYLHRSYLKHEAENAGGRIRQTWNGFAKRRRARIAGDALKGRGIFVEVPLDSVPEPVRRSGQRVRVFDRIEGDLFNGGRVIDRRYALPEAATPDQWTDRGEWQVREIRGDKAVIWRDYTKAERQHMGEIIDARYTIAKTFHLLAHDISVGRFYADIAHNDDWARTMEPAAGTWINAAEANRAWSTATGYEWVRVPDSTIPGTGGKKHWGALSGKWVRAEIWRDLNQVDQMSRQTFLDAIMRQWKQNKTSRSPVTHMNNVMSNVWLMDMADVRLRDLVGGLRSYVKEDADYAEARDNGAFGTGFVGAELKRDVLEPVLEEILRENMAAGQPESVTMLNAAGKLANGLFGAVKKADRGMRQLYGMEDDIFRMATYKRRRDLGDSPEMAAAAAREQFVDYDIRAPWINAARRSALPFLAYTYRAVPLVAKAMATKPWKLAKYAILMNALNSLGYLMEPGDEDKERKSLREEQRGWTWLMTPRMVRLGFSDEYGNPLFLDMRRWVPVGDVFDLSQGQSVIAMPGPLAQLGGVLGLGAELALNKNAFTGREIVGKVDDPFEAAGKIAGHTWRWFAPNAIWVPGSWSADKWWGAVAGERDRLGRPYNVPLATLSAFGVKAQPQDVFLGSLYRQFDYERQKREIDMASATAARDLQQGRLNQFDYVSKMRDAQTKRRALDEKFADLLRDRRFQAEQRRLRSQERMQRAQVRGRAMRELETAP